MPEGGRRQAGSSPVRAEGCTAAVVRLLERHGIGVYFGTVVVCWALMIFGLGFNVHPAVLVGGILLTVLAFGPFLLFALSPLARWRHLPAPLLGLFAWPNSYQAPILAANPSAPAWALARLALDLSLPVRAALARNPATPPATLDQLAQDPDRAVRLAVAGHLGLPLATMLALAEDPVWDVRRALALNRRAPAEVVAWLATDRHPSVRKGVAANEAASPASRALAQLGDSL